MAWKNGSNSSDHEILSDLWICGNFRGNAGGEKWLLRRKKKVFWSKAEVSTVLLTYVYTVFQDTFSQHSFTIQLHAGDVFVNLYHSPQRWEKKTILAVLVCT